MLRKEEVVRLGGARAGSLIAATHTRDVVALGVEGDTILDGVVATAFKPGEEVVPSVGMGKVTLGGENRGTLRVYLADFLAAHVGFSRCFSHIPRARCK